MARFLTPIGNYLIARPSARAAAHKITEETHVPLDAAVVVGITASALHLWSADPVLDHVGDHLGEVPLANVKEIKAEAGRSWQPMTVTLAGEDIKLEGRGAAHAVASAFKQYHPA